MRKILSQAYGYYSEEKNFEHNTGIVQIGHLWADTKYKDQPYKENDPMDTARYMNPLLF
jgi:hypothetical protein